MSRLIAGLIVRTIACISPEQTRRGLDARTSSPWGPRSTTR
jgi:hypothetical protein